MKKINSKQISLIVGTILVVVAVIFGVFIISKFNTEEIINDNVVSDNQDNTPVVEEIEESVKIEQAVEVPKIQDTETKVTDDNEEVVFIEEPMPEPPEEPELEAPKDKPETNDDLEDMENVPEYDEEDLVVEPEEEVVVNATQETKESEAIVEEESESNLVPASENPFANPANTGNPTEMQGEDLGDGEWGSGDKF
jgi:hypothetical protein